MSEKLRWGVLGTARVVRKTIPALQETKNGEVVGIASRTEERAREYADKHGVPQAFGSYDALLASPDIDAVYIALPNALHLEWMERCSATTLRTRLTTRGRWKPSTGQLGSKRVSEPIARLDSTSPASARLSDSLQTLLPGPAIWGLSARPPRSCSRQLLGTFSLLTVTMAPAFNYFRHHRRGGPGLLPRECRPAQVRNYRPRRPRRPRLDSETANSPLGITPRIPMAL
ncbi:Gfo/Idh/MocA family protein [Arthrobacter methylotrophus]|uniref:Gfo/Idh/MocA family protein n=1 Tax=Arthrobacter methylotrophus TaxID=121291 RepID=A0ABV5UTQ6_9MICC